MSYRSWWRAELLQYNMNGKKENVHEDLGKQRTTQDKAAVSSVKPNQPIPPPPHFAMFLEQMHSAMYQGTLPFPAGNFTIEEARKQNTKTVLLLRYTYASWNIFFPVDWVEIGSVYTDEFAGAISKSAQDESHRSKSLEAEDINVGIHLTLSQTIRPPGWALPIWSGNCLPAWVSFSALLPTCHKIEMPWAKLRIFCMRKSLHSPKLSTAMGHLTSIHSVVSCALPVSQRRGPAEVKGLRQFNMRHTAVSNLGTKTSGQGL